MPQQNLIGPNGTIFGEKPPTGPDETTFQVDNTSEAYFNSPYYLKHQNDVQPVPMPRAGQPVNMTLASVLNGSVDGNNNPVDIIGAITNANKITFHAVGDTGAAKNNDPSTEAGVADMMAADINNAASLVDAPAFFFHLGDVIYYFGESQYYYDQFYEPFRNYQRPIFAIPGNHDGVVFGPDANMPQVPTLQAFLQVFCDDPALAPRPSPYSGGLMRSNMTLPGVYFTLDAPFVSIIGLYSNVLEGPGVISPQVQPDGTPAYPTLDNRQLEFLQSELTRLKPERDAGNLAVIVAVHHPPVSADAVHSGAVGLSQDLDSAFQAAGLYPDAVLSGHAHLYQRFTRNVTDSAGNAIQIPYIVSGSGGFAATRPTKKLPPLPYTIGDVTLEEYYIGDYGYLILTADFSASPKTLTITFRSTNSTVDGKDSVPINLETRQIIR